MKARDLQLDRLVAPDLDEAKQKMEAKATRREIFPGQGGKKNLAKLQGQPDMMSDVWSRDLQLVEAAASCSMAEYDNYTETGFIRMLFECFSWRYAILLKDTHRNLKALRQPRNLSTIHP